MVTRYLDKYVLMRLTQKVIEKKDCRGKRDELCGVVIVVEETSS